MAPRKTPTEAWYSPALDPPNVSEKNLTLTRLMTVAQGNMGATVLKAGSAHPEDQGSTFYPLFVSAIIAGLVPPFSEFFFAVLRQYNLQALHLHPNSVLLLAIFAYYCEAHVGVMPLSGLPASLLFPPGFWCPHHRMCELYRILQLQCHLEAWEEDRRLPEQVGHGGHRAHPPPTSAAYGAA